MRRGGRDDDPPVREWLQEPPRGWGDEFGARNTGGRDTRGRGHRYDARGQDDDGGYGAGSGFSAGGRRRAGRYDRDPGYYDPPDADSTGYGLIEPFVPAYRAGTYGEFGSGSYPEQDRDPLDEDDASPVYRRRRRAGEDYIPRRAANEPPTRPADGRPRRSAGTPGDDAAREEPAGRRRPDGKPKRKRKQMPLWQEMPLLLIVAFCLAVLIRTFLVQAFYIPSASMTDTLLVGDRVLVNKVIYDMREPRHGEIVVFSGTDSWVPEVPPEKNQGFMAKLGRTIGDLIGVTRPGDKDFIKRVIGLPGDRVSCCDAQGRVQVNGKPLDEPYVLENSPLDAPPNPRECRSRRFDEVVVEPGEMWVMGDHRLVSQDARCQGPVPLKNVIGKAFVIVWPNEHWATLPTPSTFDNVPPPRGVAARPVAATSTVTDAPSGIFGIVMPILLPLVFPARTRSKFSGRRRRLAE